MTEKRFTLMSVVNFDYGINDNDKPIGSLSNICDLLNELNEENEQLYELIDFANTLIAFKTSESCQKEWEKRLKELV